jgi:hypothetical protein
MSGARRPHAHARGAVTSTSDSAAAMVAENTQRLRELLHGGSHQQQQHGHAPPPPPHGERKTASPDRYVKVYHSTLLNLDDHG